VDNPNLKTTPDTGRCCTDAVHFSSAPLLSARAVAVLLRVDPTLAYEALSDGQLPSVVIGRTRLVSAAALLRLMGRPVPPRVLLPARALGCDCVRRRHHQRVTRVVTSVTGAITR
jgi:hypothetical protein